MSTIDATVENAAVNASKNGKGQKSTNNKENAMSTDAPTTVATPAATTPAAPVEPAKKRVMAPRPVLPVSYAFAAADLNTSLNAVFGGQLIEAMSKVADGSFVDSPVPVITVTYVPSSVDTKPREQTFALVMGTGFPESFSILDMLVAGSDKADTAKLLEAMDTFKNVGVENLQILPITGKAINSALPLLSQLRGQSGDKTPMDINSKPMGRVYAKVEEGALKWFSMDGAALTEYQQRVLTKWFGEGIISSITVDMLSGIFKGTAARFLSQMTDVKGLRAQLDEIEALASTYLAE